MTPTQKPIVILGIFVADTAYRADRQPKMGETIMGHSFVLGPGCVLTLVDWSASKIIPMPGKLL